jgi:hypothetical protein
VDQSGRWDRISSEINEIAKQIAARHRNAPSPRERVAPPQFHASITRVVTPSDFWRAFRFTVAGLASIGGGLAYRRSWRSKRVLHDRVPWGDHEEKGLLPSLAELLGLHYRREFLGVDVVLHRGTVASGPLAVPADILVAIEHENDPNTSGEEMSKLSWMAVPLKVLITYPRSGPDERQLLNRYSRILAGAGAAASNSYQLVIFGLPGLGQGARWKAYVYSDEDDRFNALEAQDT